MELEGRFDRGAPGARRCGVSEVLIPLAHGTCGEEPDWQERALCAQTDPEAYFQ
jgi:hypothetical protein